jgi:hypothetical protein
MYELKNELILFVKDNQYDLEEVLIHFEYPKRNSRNFRIRKLEKKYF